ncbi:oligopeptide ABC transporter permease [Alkalihalobacillus sp. AL-G]|uniref:oligopeptide ABC transporter permease n=1 Tax=Alkalihalobacillus sp. AL-G TaxID=2926399 RepID=UPI00272D3769|nr:oligopeptide ABC transporter permease [Alkalihalobacillus sp. AL-G]WLD94788.1 ABC transporter permease [Alkalihalobacillus sp. AL-G]
MSQPENQLRPNVPVPPEPLAPFPQEKPDTLTKIAIDKFVKNKLAVIGLIVLTLIIASAICAPLLTHYNPADMQLLKKLQPPNSEHWLGVDTLGRDMYTRLLYGARVSLLVGFASVTASIFIGTIIGAFAGYYGGKIDAFLMRVVDVFLSFPSLFLLITLVTIFEPSIDKLILAFALFGWTTTARLVRGEFLSLRSREFVLAAKTMGVKSYKIIFSHILPNAMGPIIVTATLNVGIVILAESALSYLGLGIQPPTPSWGNMLQDAQSLTIMNTAPWYPIFPGVMILITVLAFNFVGDGLRDAFDPKMKS